MYGLIGQQGQQEDLCMYGLIGQQGVQGTHLAVAVQMALYNTHNSCIVTGDSEVCVFLGTLGQFELPQQISFIRLCVYVSTHVNMQN